MKATELMIGDWLCNNNCIVLKKEFQVYPYFIPQCKDNELEDMNIEPIPLTPEILEKNGGKNNHIQPNDDWDIEYRYSAEGGVFVRVTEIGDELTPSRTIFAKELDYVHQYQHLLRLCELDELADSIEIMTREEEIKMLTSEEWLYDEHNFTEDEIAAIKSVCNPWHKVSEELPEVDKYRKCIKVFARRGDDVFVAFYSPIVGFSLSSSFYTEYILSNIEYWMPIPELPKED